jgi:hypothetical protein
MTTRPEILVDYHRLGNLYKGLVVYACHLPRKCLRVLQIWALRKTRIVGEVCDLCRVKTNISPVLMVRAGWSLT